MIDSVGLSSTQWGDYDNDGDSTFLLLGKQQKKINYKGYENQSLQPK